MSSETLYGVVILFLLATIAAGVLIKQAHYETSAYNATAAQVGTAGGTSQAVRIRGPQLTEISPENFEPMGPQEAFNPETLSDKINGKAELYLDAGFEQLVARRFVHTENTASWFEVYLYDMADPKNALSVYSLQKRAEGEMMDLAQRAYETPNAIYFMSAKYYVEIVSAEDSEEMKSALIEAGNNLLQKLPREGFEAPEFAFLPPDDMMADSEKFYPDNAYSFADLDKVVSVKYAIGGEEITAFVSIRNDESEASSLAGKYHDFLTQMGAEKVDPGESEIPNLLASDVLGDYEYIFSVNNILAGIHAAPDKELGKQLAERIYRHIKQQ